MKIPTGVCQFGCDIGTTAQGNSLQWIVSSGPDLRVLVCGGRHDKRQRLGIWALRTLFAAGELGSAEELIGIEGCATGWDTFGRVWFWNMGLSAERGTLHHFPIRAKDWDRYGLGAGPVRNRQMLVEGKPDKVIAGPGGNGTADMIEQANSAGVPVVDLTKESWFQDGVVRYHALYGNS